VRFLPPPDNTYHGSRLAVWFLWLQILVNAGRGFIHVFWDDSGAGRIAGIDLSVNGAPIVSLLALVGIDQLVWGAIELGVVIRYRRWIPTLLAILLAKQVGAAWLLWLWKPLGVEAPGKFGAIGILPIVLIALWLSLRESPSASSAAHPRGRTR
jgi:hypothetical protein